MKKKGTFPQCHRPQFLYPSNGDNNAGLDYFPGINLNNALRSRFVFFFLVVVVFYTVKCGVLGRKDHEENLPRFG